MSIAVTKINNVDVATYGLRLQRHNGHLDMSAKKQSTSVFDETADVFFEDRKITFEFYGKYSTPEAAGNAVGLFNQNVSSVIEGAIDIYPPNYDIDNPAQRWVGRFVYGTQTQIQYGNAVFITLAMKWQGKSFS